MPIQQRAIQENHPNECFAQRFLYSSLYVSCCIKHTGKDILKDFSSFFPYFVHRLPFEACCPLSHVGDVGPFGPVQDVFRASQDISGLLKASGLGLLDKIYYFLKCF